ncbi:hypothetical protein CDD80_525 [Ophiocordyceps camponoti-rufipedis]|uniref:Phospholipid/glycerol acyltransferase domain-containing protein n=1 Tax=Ophiocordyceps camponoti-rufipedis TaxID=2004952 RepID=A0A2C5ZCA4_9HYPO|nr:hypothetical protein CDD80_525 [Ophiocordyceps camponoti-rufipedis]
MLMHGFLFFFRLPIFLGYALCYFIVFHYLPLPVVARKVALWGLMAVPGIWWVDLQLDGVRRGTLSEQPRERVPHAGSVMAATFTSPIDAVYLAAVFDPIFTVSYPGDRRLRRVGLLGAVAAALGPVRTAPPDDDTHLIDINDLLAEFPNRVIAVFPECGTTNGKAILPLSPALAQCRPDVHIFPVSIRYDLPDVTTPVPGQWLAFFWNLLSRPTTCIRVRIAEGRRMDTTNGSNGSPMASPATPQFPRRRIDPRSSISNEEKRLLDRLAESLARLSRVKRVGLTMTDKAAFVAALRGTKT